MQVLYPRCAALDVHKSVVVACARIAQAATAVHEVRSFDTTTAGLLELVDWLESFDIKEVAMEATGAYWKPVWHILDGHFELILANAAHVKNVPGRKTDVNDATWLVDLLAHGLIRASFVPPTQVQALRTLTRTRKQFVRERASHVQRIEKLLEDANIKLGLVLTDTMGKSGRAILQAIVQGQTDPQRLAALVSSRVKASPAQLREALRGRVSPHHRFMLKIHLAHIDALDKAITEIETEVGLGLEPFRRAAELLTTIPGISQTGAHVIIAEIGVNMSRFPSAAHLVSWASLCPRNDQSAGKRRSTRTRPGANWLKPLLVQAAWAGARTKNSYLQAQFHRLRARRGAKKAIIAVAASILTAIWHMLSTDSPWKDLGRDFFDRHDPAKAAKRLIRKLQQIGYSVQATPA